MSACAAAVGRHDLARAVDGAALRLREIGQSSSLTLLTPFDQTQRLDHRPRPGQ